MSGSSNQPMRAETTRITQASSIRPAAHISRSRAYAFKLNADATPPQQQGEAETPTNPNDTTALLKQLNLSPDQVTQIRTIQAESVPQAQTLRRHLNQAQRALNESIYSDAADEALI